jgi:predicted Rossmann fold flavoprotein
MAQGPGGARWRVATSRGPIEATSVILATGGLSVPQTGSDGSGLRFAESLGHQMVAPYPALTPLKGPAPGGAALAGVSLTVRVRARSDEGSAEGVGGFLFTHRGYSGPSVLDVSHIATRSHAAVVRVQWIDRTPADWEREIQASGGLVRSTIGRALPERLADALCLDAHVPLDRRVAELKRTERVALIERLTACVLSWTGDEGYAKAEVTGGGVALSEVNSRTLESLRHPGMYFCGEILDAFGPIGGHNFSWAWATGRTAGAAAGGHGD